MYNNGDKYEGEFLNSKKNGQGKYTFKNGTEYIGEFKEDCFDGNGRLNY